MLYTFYVFCACLSTTPHAIVLVSPKNAISVCLFPLPAMIVSCCQLFMLAFCYPLILQLKDTVVQPFMAL